MKIKFSVQFLGTKWIVDVRVIVCRMLYFVEYTNPFYLPDF